MHTFQTKTRHPDDQPIDRGDAGIAVFGMGPVGIAAYDDMRERHGDIVLGVDQDPDVVLFVKLCVPSEVVLLRCAADATRFARQRKFRQAVKRMWQKWLHSNRDAVRAASLGKT